MAYLNLAVPPGVVKGATAYDSRGRWWDASQVRWRNGVMEPIGGWQRVSQNPLTGKPRGMYGWRDNSDIPYICIGTETKLYILSGGTYLDRTPSDLQPFTVGGLGFGAADFGEEDYGDARSSYSGILARQPFWTFANYGEDLFTVSTDDGRLLRWSPSTAGSNFKENGIATISTIARSSNVVTVTTSAAHSYVSGNQVIIRDCATASFNGTFTNITVTGSTTFTYAQTGSNESASSGTATPGTPRDNKAVVVTPERHVVLIGAGGNPRRVAWSSREDPNDWLYTSTTNTAGYLDLDSRSELITGRGITQGTLIWSDRQLYLMRFIGSPFVYSIDAVGETALLNGTSVATFGGRAVWMTKDGFAVYDGSLQPLACPVSRYIFDDMDPIAGPNRAFACANGKFPEVWFFYPSNGSQECNKYAIWNYQENWWSIGSLSRSAMVPAGTLKYPYLATVEGNIFEHENGWTDSGASRVGQIYCESGVLNLDDSDRELAIMQAIPASGTGVSSLNASFYSRQTTGGSERSFGPYSTRSDGYMDTRVKGRDIRIRITGANDEGWSVGAWRLNYKAGARR